MDLKEWALNATAPQRHPWELARLDAVERLLAKNIDSSDLRVLDFGCGDAFVASSLAERLTAKEVSAVDRAFTPEARDLIAPHLSRRVSLFESLDAAAKKMQDPANLVLLLDVLEHCEDDKAVLDSLMETSAVASDAIFLITVPAYQSLFSKHDTFLGHYRRYDRRSLTNLVREAGLELQGASYFFSSLLVPRGAQLIVEKAGLSKSEPKGLGAHKAGWSDSVIRQVLGLDFRICSGLASVGVYVPGLSCFAIAKKKNGPSS